LAFFREAVAAAALEPDPEPDFFTVFLVFGLAVEVADLVRGINKKS
jgi:hypothetical protein